MSRDSGRTVIIDQNDPIVITAQSAVASLGLDAKTCAAAARAGVRRAQELDYFRFNGPNNRSVECAIGHPTPLLTNGFEGHARLGQLLGEALRGLPITAMQDVSANTTLFASLPSTQRLSSGSCLIDDAAARASFLQSEEEPLPSEDAPLRTLRAIVERTPLRGTISSHAIVGSGHTGLAESLHAATTALIKGQCRFAIAGAADSLVDERTLGWLRITGRLKSQGNPAGLEPGEAAAFFLLEKWTTAESRRAKLLSKIVAISRAQESRSQIDGQAPSGLALSDVFEDVVEEVRKRPEAAKWILTDHNGETIRALEFGIVLSRVLPFFSGLSPIVWHPAISFGDTGVASAGLSTVLAHEAFARAYAPSDTAIILSSSDGPARSAFALTKPF